MIVSVKRKSPTTMKSPPLPLQIESKETDKEQVEDPLEQQFKSLEQEWSFFKQSNPPKNSQCSTDSNVTDDYFRLTINNSKTEGYSAVEILKDRWDAIESGELKGRRLFEDLSDGETEEDVCSECFQESEGGRVSACGSDEDENENVVRRLGPDCCYCPSLSSSESEEIVEGEVVMETEKAERESGNGGIVGCRNIWLGVVIALLGVILAVCVVSRKFKGGYAKEVTIVPT